MGDEDEVLDLGARHRMPPGVRVLAVLLAAAGVVAFVVLRGGDDDEPSSAPRTSPGPVSRSVIALPPVAPTTGESIDARPPWPQRSSACGGTSFLPLVSSEPLHRHTGIQAVVGDRLTTVDVDSGSTSAAAGLPRGQYASAVIRAGGATYAALRGCGENFDSPASVVRLDAHGTMRTIARGRYDSLVGGGDHPWGVLAPSTSERTLLDPLDGGPRRLMPKGFGPIGAYGELVVGTIESSNASANDPAFRVGVVDPRTGRMVRQLGPAGAVAVSNGVIVWAGPACTTCVLHVLDLRTGRSSATKRPVSRVIPWSGVVSPDGRTAAFIRVRTTPSRYEMGHPGNPNEIVTVDLESGAVHPVPGLVLWSKSFPGLTFSADSRWLLMGLDEGSDVRLLLWRPGLDRPLQSPARLRTPVAYTPAVTPIG